jgi:hypothetical protein
MNRILRYVFATVCLLACGLLIPGQTTPNGNSANSGAAGDSARSRAAQSMLHLLMVPRWFLVPLAARCAWRRAGR